MANPVFTVSLEGIDLTDEQVKRIDAGIKDVVMREIASVDHRADLAISRKLTVNPLFKTIKIPEWFGIWVLPQSAYQKYFKV